MALWCDLIHVHFCHFKKKLHFSWILMYDVKILKLMVKLWSYFYLLVLTFKIDIFKKLGRIKTMISIIRFSSEIDNWSI